MQTLKKKFPEDCDPKRESERIMEYKFPRSQCVKI